MVQQLKALFSLSRDAVIGLDSDLVAFCNDAAMRRFGGDLTGRPASELIPLHILKEAASQFVVSDKLCGEFVSMSVTRCGSITLLAVPTQESPPARSALAGDIRSDLFTLRLSAEHIFLRAGKSESVLRNKAIFFHTYYTLLRAVKNADLADSIAKGTTVLRTDKLELNSLCENVVARVRDMTEGICAAPEFLAAPQSVYTNADKELLTQMLLSLLCNSLAHTPPDGKITVCLERADGSAVLSVSDNGSGIEPQVLSSVFEPGAPDADALAHQTQGLGLYLAAGIARLHDGSLLIESQPQSGTRVRVRLHEISSSTLRFRAPASDNAFHSGEEYRTQLSVVLPSRCYVPGLDG